MIAKHETLEQRRLELQATLDSAKSQEQRNKLGQFATPTALAEAVLCLARTVLRSDCPVRFLDPAFGTGAFYSALTQSFPRNQIQWARGYEIDPHYGIPAQALWEGTPLALTLGDFTTATPPACQDDKATLIVCNPPYVRHHHLDAKAKHRLRAACMDSAGVDLNGLTGLYCYFLALSHGWMADDAIAVWLIPSEFMDVNYGRALKEYLLNRVTLLRIHRFDPAEVQFGDALVSSAVVVFRKAPPPKGHAVQFTYGGTLDKPCIARSVAKDDLSPQAKWTRLAHPVNKAANRDGRLKLADLFTIKRGIATGANDFFMLSESAAQNMQLPAKFLRPILPSPRLVRADEIPADDCGNPDIDHRLMLLDCRLSENDVRQEYPELWSYLEAGRAKDLHKRYICSHREPWYSQDDREPAPILCTYMGRTNSEGKTAFRFILNHSKAIVANVYLMLYPKPALAKIFRNRPDALKAVWRALNDIPWDSLLSVGRVYGGGLHKMEPNELAQAPADTILAALPEVASSRGTQLTLSW